MIKLQLLGMKSVFKNQDLQMFVLKLNKDGQFSTSWCLQNIKLHDFCIMTLDHKASLSKSHVVYQISRNKHKEIKFTQTHSQIMNASM